MIKFSDDFDRKLNYSTKLMNRYPENQPFNTRATWDFDYHYQD